MSETITEIRERIGKLSRSNMRAAGLNNFIFNYGWIAALAASIAAGFSDEVSSFGAPTWFSPLLGMFAATWIAVDKRLSFGGRWRHHRSIYQELDGIEDSLIFLATKDAQDADRELPSILQKISDTRARAAEIPGAGQ